MTPADDLAVRAFEFSAMRARAMKPAPRCPLCDTAQVQLRDWSVNPTEWRCRHCRHEFFIQSGFKGG